MGAYLPESVVTSDELEESLRSAGIPLPAGFIERATGIESRRIAGPDENASDLAVAAAQQALEHGQTSADQVELLIFAAASHDVTEPATANIVQAKLAARNAAVFDLKNACNSLLSALDVADAYIRLARARTVLIVTGEMPSLVTNARLTSRRELAENFSHLTMGDAGGALLLTASGEAGICASAGVSRGDAWELGTVLSFGSMYRNDPRPEHALLRSRGDELEERARAELPAIIRAALEAAQWEPGSVDVVACHQHTRRIAQEISTTVGIPADRLPLPLKYAGNAVSANIPLALAEACRTGMLAPGARVLLCGGSAGFSAIATALTW